MRDLPAKSRFRVFLNYPFDAEFYQYSVALNFGVTAANLIPVCARDLGTPDQLRLALLAELVSGCDYSAHDLSRSRPDPKSGIARLNMPLEAGMALYRSISPNQQPHRCALLVTDPHDYKTLISDLAGLDAMHYWDDLSLVKVIYEWLATVLPQPIRPTAATAHVVDIYVRLKQSLDHVCGTGIDGRLSHPEMQELVRRVCSATELWTWRIGPLKDEFPPTPLMFQHESIYKLSGDHLRTGSMRATERGPL